MEIALRPFELVDVERYEAALASPEGTGAFQWFGFTSARRLRHRFASGDLIDDEEGTLAVVSAAGERVGHVEWFRASWGRIETSGCWRIAIGIDAAFRGRGFGTAAQRALVDYLFRHTTYVRVEASTDIANVAERRALTRCGFAEEGVLRAAQWRDGAYHDQVLYAIVRPSIAASAPAARSDG